MLQIVMLIIMAALSVLTVVGLIVSALKRNNKSKTPVLSAEEAIAALKKGNLLFAKGRYGGDISVSRRQGTAENGQNPFAVIVTCSDSRVPAELIFQPV